MDSKLSPKRERPDLGPRSTREEQLTKHTLPKPFNDMTRQAIERKTLRLIEKRTMIDRELHREASTNKTSTGNYLHRAKLLIQQSRLHSRQLRLRKQLAEALTQQKRRYLLGPTEERAKDLALIRTLHRKVKKSIKPLVESDKDLARKLTEQRQPEQDSSSSCLSSEHEIAKSKEATTGNGSQNTGNSSAISPPKEENKTSASQESSRLTRKRKDRHEQLGVENGQKVAKAKKNTAPKSAVHSDDDETVLKPSLKNQENESQHETPVPMKQVAGESTSENRKKLKKAKKNRKDESSEARGDEPRGSTEQPVKKVKENHSASNTPSTPKVADANPAVSPDEKLVLKKSPKKEKAESKSTTTDDRGGVKVEEAIPVIRISPAIASATQDVLTPAPPQPQEIDPDEEYYSRRRTEILNNPLGFRDRVKEVPPHRRKKSRSLPGSPGFMSGALDAPLFHDNKRGHSSVIKRNRDENSHTKAKQGDKTRALTMTPARSTIGQKGRPHSSSPHAAATTGRKAELIKKPKWDEKGTFASGIGAGKFHTVTNSPKPTDNPISRQASVETLHLGEERGRSAAVKKEAQEKGGYTLAGFGPLDPRLFDGVDIDAHSLDQLMKFPSSSPHDVRHAENVDTQARGTNMQVPVRIEPPKPEAIYHTETGRGVHIKDPMARRPR
ncbi:hypothetical protein GQ53DRAFT_408227 [Thozetella sp. PMI_491]|nr:hypothetical protein GQ53DRAFT_408227 [Thozetella sp. PMI_491]